MILVECIERESNGTQGGKDSWFRPIRSWSGEGRSDKSHSTAPWRSHPYPLLPCNSKHIPFLHFHHPNENTNPQLKSSIDLIHNSIYLHGNAIGGPHLSDLCDWTIQNATSNEVCCCTQMGSYTRGFFSRDWWGQTFYARLGFMG